MLLATRGEITRLLDQWNSGEPQALERLMPQIFDEVRDLAARALRREIAPNELQPTELVAEVYLRLTKLRTVQWQNREHLFGSLADLIRRILVDNARRTRAAKRGGQAVVLSFEAILEVPDTARPPDLLELNDALEKLQVIDQRRHYIVICKFFLGLKNEEIAEILEVSVKTVERQWRLARIWLRHALHPVRTRTDG